MGKAIKALLGTALVGMIGLVIYGYSVDMAPPPAPQTIDVVLDAN